MSGDIKGITEVEMTLEQQLAFDEIANKQVFPSSPAASMCYIFVKSLETKGFRDFSFSPKTGKSGLTKG